MQNAIVVLALLGALSGAALRAQVGAQAAPGTCSFSGEGALEGWVLEATGEAAKRMPAPKVAGERLLLLESWWRSSAAAALPAPSGRPARVVEVGFSFVMNTGTEGLGFAWLDVERHGLAAAIPAPLDPAESRDPGGNEHVELPPWGWEAPNLRRAFGVGFDAIDLPNREPFRGSGNVYDRPQHLVSLHWDGLEIVKSRTTADFRDEQPHRASLRVEFVTGGAEVTLSLDEEALYERFFIAGMTAFAGRPVFGARNGETAGDVLLDDVTIALGESIDAPPAPTRVVAFERVLNAQGHGRNEATVTFPDDTDAYGRIVATLRLDKPETRFDPWDRSAHVWIETDADPPGAEPERFELIRYITPYHRGWEWVVDVSDFRPLLRGPVRLVQQCGTRGEGWLVSLAFDLHPGPAPLGLHATSIVNLWQGGPEVGNPDKPPSEFFVPREIEVPAGTIAARVRTVVSGHGMSPNTDNAAEFMPLGRTLVVGGVAHHDVLWKDDNDLNPCRPQGGTWKYDRAGWAPGDIVRPWEVPVPAAALGAPTLRVEYALDEYLNENRGQTWAPFHLVQAQLVLYGRVGEPPGP